jgi:hypothetical protein
MVVARLSGASKKRSRSDFGPPSTVSPYTSSVSPLVDIFKEKLQADAKEKLDANEERAAERAAAKLLNEQ